MTEPRRWRGLAPVSVRTRLAVVIALLTALAMAGAGLLVYALESSRIDAAVREQIGQEVAEFRTLQEEGVDPRSGRPFTSVGSLLDVFLVRNVPDDDEMIVGYAEGRPTKRTVNRHGAEFLGETAYQDAVDRLMADGGTSTVRSGAHGEVWVTAVPVRGQGSSGALVIINFLDDEHTELDRTMRTYAMVALLSLGLITLIATYQSGRLLSPLRTLRDTASDITASDLSRRIPVTGNDDLTALTRTINDMLDRLDAAFTGQRQFLDDAGHELKTPLTVLRGHLELLDASDPVDLAETREVLLEEVDRMSRLVGDLILLAKARRPDFLDPRPVDLADLTHTVLVKARALGSRDWQLDGVSDAILVVDEQRLTQAVLSLADNAVKHTDEGDVVALGSTSTPEGTALWVRDSGPGIPEEHRGLVLERFGRSHVRADDEGFGLGLSIVSAIAEAHGGSVRIEDAAVHGVEPGAMVVLSLPPAGTPPAGGGPSRGDS
jgi:signal transduction histidine kinase